MPDQQDMPQLMLYHIRLQGHLDRGWGEWFGGVTVTSADDGTTLLICQVIDQAALHGLLRHICDLNLPLLSVNRIHPSEDGHS